MGWSLSADEFMLGSGRSRLLTEFEEMAMSGFDPEALLRPTVFIGSSSTQESLDVAVLLQDDLQQNGVEADVWSHDIFEVGSQTLTELQMVLRRYDFGVMVFWPDDDLTLGRTTYKATRDNVILELGMFLGALGPDRAFILRNQNTTRRLSDLAGVTVAEFTPRQNLKAAASAAIKKIRDRIRLSRPQCIRDFDFNSLEDGHAYIGTLLRQEYTNTVRQVSLTKYPYAGMKAVTQFAADMTEFLTKDGTSYFYVYNPAVSTRQERVKKLIQPTTLSGLRIRELSGDFPDDMHNFILFDDRELIVIMPRGELPNHMRLYRRCDLVPLYAAHFRALFASGTQPAYWPSHV